MTKTVNAEPSDFATIVRVRLGMPAQLAADPVFRHSPESVLAGGGQTRAELDRLLARGVPALSGPVGSRELSNIPEYRNVNLNGRTGGSLWPRSNASAWKGWQHGDIRIVALPFVHSPFAEIVRFAGGLP